MAEKDKDDAEIVLDEDGVVTLDVDPALAEKEEKDDDVEIEAKPEPKKVIPRVKLDDQKAVKQPAADEAAKVLLETQKQVAAANATAQAERVARQNAERLAQQARADADEARTATESAQLTLIDNGIDAATQEITSFENQLATAYEAGDFKGAAAIQAKLGKSTAKLDRLESQKADYESGAKRAPTTEGRVESPQVIQPSAFEQYVANFAPEAQTWLRSHPECVPAQYGGNAQANSKMMKGHYAALAENIAPNTPEYFRVIEESTGHRQPTSRAAEVTEAEEAEPAVKVAPKVAKKPQPSAPPSREPSTAQGLGGKRTVTLSKEQQDMAKISFPQLPVKDAFAQYAKNLVELEAEGKIGRMTH